MGFSGDYVCKRFIPNSHFAVSLTGMIALLIALSAFPMNQQAIRGYFNQPENMFSFRVIRNAVFYPPPIQALLKPTSIILLEDSRINNWYLLGAGGTYSGSSFPLPYDGQDNLLKSYYSHFVPIKPDYNGSLFRWAYLMPNIREEAYHFKIEAMNDVPNETIQRWWQNAKDIICLGYDNQGQWHDRTASFQKNLLQEKSEREVFLQADKMTKVHTFVIGGK